MSFINQLLPINNAYSVSLYLDERGTPGTDGLFITGGVLVYGENDTIAEEWLNFAVKHGIWSKKGTKLEAQSLLDATAFIVQQCVLPIAIWSELTSEELKHLRKVSDQYRQSKNQRKRSDKISPAVWIWTHQMAQSVAYAESSFLRHIGKIIDAGVFIDKFMDQIELQRYYAETLQNKLSTRKRTETAAIKFGTSQEDAYLLGQAIPEYWSVDLNAKGPLHHLSDVVCAMFGRFHSGEYRDAWDIIRMRFTEDGRNPVCLGANATWTVREYLDEMDALLQRL